MRTPVTSVTRLLASALLCGFLAAPAQAIEARSSSGGTELQLHGVRLEGSTVLANGLELAYDLTARCGGEPLPCLVAGTLTGPLGRDWSLSGLVSRRGENVEIALAVDAPDGRPIEFTITMAGERLAGFLQRKGGETCEGSQL